MRTERKQDKGKAGSTTPERATSNRGSDPFAAQVSKMSKALGNEELHRQITKGNTTRDQLLQFLVDRLHTIRNVQLKELDLETRQREWWKEVTLTDRDMVRKPDPTRWHEAADLYEQASAHLCRGNLGQGAQLVKDAIEAEKRAFDNLTDLVHLQEEDQVHDEPATVDHIQHGQQCTPCDVPEQVDLARQIKNAIWVIEDPPNRRRVRDPWWALEEEEEEEESQDEA